MLFVIIALSCVAVCVLFIIFDKKTGVKFKKIFPSMKPKEKVPPADLQKEKSKKDLDTEVDFKQIDYNTFKDPIVKEESDDDQHFDPNESSSNKDVQPSVNVDKTFQDFLDDINQKMQDETDDEFVPSDISELMSKRIDIGGQSLQQEVANMRNEISSDDIDDAMSKFDFNQLDFEDETLADKFRNLPDELKALFVIDIFKTKL